MENESTFVAPEGVYSVTEEHKPNPLAQHTIAAAPILYPTRISTVSVRFSVNKPTNSPGLSQLLGGGREKEVKKEKVVAKEREREDGVSVSSSDDPDDGSPDASSVPAHDGAASTPTIPHEQPSTPFALTPATIGKRKSAPRPKHNMRTTSSTFITRLQNADNLSRSLQSKQGDTSFLFYNAAKTFVWTEAGTKLKVRPPSNTL